MLAPIHDPLQFGHKAARVSPQTELDPCFWRIPPPANCTDLILGVPSSGGTGGHIGRMSVLAGLRRHGIGGQILSFLERTARDMGIHQIILHAQVYVKSFYINHGYQEEGSVFIEAGIDHIEMRKDI